ncbi:hypothetical protein OPV22_021145 [Ensete ventricosum]|uniref:Glutaredoxin domain-containing protein n=1 Tax=Ensete ventricosum TaxID=4639 RepID=A0A426ZQJ2_ENSVE|nr:hypothetical protein OPV22_021145 [Ensete ventricosum]RRT66279.1 hypothetical protein B296_00030165 [Ensete ventricosum]RWW62233.1 hypothetical protein BHE74_00030653 [Ensete ventricosum]RZS07916.1 hypothetical protein BHM03_00038837 [Ensete ventricosum]
MKGIRGRILKKLRSIPQVPYLKYQERVLHVHASAPSPPTPPPDPSRVLRDLPVGSRVEAASNSASDDDRLTPVSHLHDVVDVAELMRDLEEEEADCDEEESDLSSSRSSIGDKENSRPPPSSPPKEASSWRTNDEEDQHGQEDVPSYRRPDLDSVTLFDPELLAAFEKAVVEHMRSFEEAKSRARARIEEEEYDEHDGGGRGEPHVDEEPPSKVPRTDDDEDPLTEFEHRCPPGGRESVILYTTTLRGIRKTFEDCNGVRFLLESLKVRFTERDVSMHLEFREELWRVLGCRAIPPSLFIRGRYVGGADEVLGLHEQGRLLALLRGAPRDRSAGEEACRGCGGVRFVVCWECNGSRKIYHGEEEEEEEEAGPAQCRHCNENGLVVCPICC